MCGRITAIAGILLAFTWTTCAIAQSYPNRRISVVVPTAVGSIADTLGRAIAQNSSEMLVENVPGALGTIGTTRVEQSAPDGYTLLLRQQGVLPSHDLVGVTLLGRAPLVLVAHPHVNAKNLSDVIALLRSKTGRMHIASAGPGTTSHYAYALFSTISDVRPVHVPFRGAGPALTDVLGGNSPLAFVTLRDCLPYVASGNLRALAVTGPTRHRSLPDVPTFAEAGLPGMTVSEWIGVFAPRGTPEPIVSAAAKKIQEAAAEPAVEERLLAMGFERTGLVGREFDNFVAAELRPDTKVEPPDCCKPKTCEDMKLCPK